MRTTLFTGFLGAGKTTALTRLLRELARKEKVGVIVSDLSELEVDGELIRNGDIVSEKEGTLASFTGGSLDGPHRDTFLDSLNQMHQRGLDHLLIEASGSADPTALLDILANSAEHLQGVVIALVDARTLQLDYDCGNILLNEKVSQSPAHRLLLRQIKSANVLALSKTDLLDDQALEEILRNLALINPGATLTVCTYGQLDQRALTKHRHVFRVATREDQEPLSPDSCDIGTTVISDPRPFHPQRFYDLYRDRLGMGIFRTKGFLWFASRPEDVLLWNQAGGAMGLELMGAWRAAAVTDSRLLPEERQHLADLLSGAHPVFGDRNCELTVIGTERDRSIFCREMLDTFCSDDEVKMWQSGHHFADPWPKSLRTIS